MVILDQFYKILGNKEGKNAFLLTVIIRTVGTFAKAIVKIKGSEYLN